MAKEYPPYEKGAYRGKIARDKEIHTKGQREHWERNEQLVRQAETHEAPFWSGQYFIDAVEGYIAGYLGDELLDV